MFELLIGIFIFCIILFLYLHIYYHLKTSNDLEIFEIDEPSKDKMEEICDLRQPVLFDFPNENIIEKTNKTTISQQFYAFDVKIRNTLDNKSDTSELYVPFPLKRANQLFQEDKESRYYSENNHDFLLETGVIKQFQYNDAFLRPYFVSNCFYDILLGSEGVKTPFRYELNYRNFYVVTEGEIQIKMAPPTCARYLHTLYDYDNFEYTSLVNIWAPQEIYKSDIDKIKCLEITVRKGQTLFIPAYWWYSISFSKDSSISCFRYRTFMNTISIIPHIGMYILQHQNIKRNITQIVKEETVKE